MQLFAWIDWNRDGDWNDAGEQIINNATAAEGINTAAVTVPAGASLGYSYVRVRACSTDTSCNSPIGEASDGEVEDYRMFISTLIPSATCDTITQTKSNGANFDYVAFDPTTDPVQFSPLASPLSLTDYPNILVVNALGYNRVNGLYYGLFRDGNSVTEDFILFITDRSGTDFIPIGKVYADGAQSFNHAGNGAVNFTDGQALSRTGSGTNTSGINRGDVSPDGQYLYAWSGTIDALIRIDLSTQQFTAIALSATPNLDGDIAFNPNNNLLYSIDLAGGNYTEINPSNGNVTTNATTFIGLLPVDNTGGANAGGMASDDGVNLYAFANGGDHDTDGDGTHDLIDKTAVYQLNVVTGELIFVSEGLDVSLTGNDAAGCYYSRDYGDAPASYGDAYHSYSDTGADGYSALDGDQDLVLGVQWDSEFMNASSSDATGDDNKGLNDERGVTMPASITVETSTLIPVSVPQASGFLNVFVDLNGDGDFADTGELVFEDQVISAATTNLDFNLDANLTSGYDGDTFVRFRLCSTIATCNTATGGANDGEVEDYLFDLINQIVLNGTVFEDNGIGGMTAHNGRLEGEEQRLANYVVKVIYNDAPIPGYTTGQEIMQTVTNGNGRFSLVLGVEFANKDLLLEVVPQSAWIDISESDVTDPLLGLVGKVTNTSITDSQMLINANAGDNLDNLDFGKVTMPILEPDNYTETEPGVPVFVSHKFNTNTSGNVSFTITNQSPSPSGYSWSDVLYFDTDCDGELDGGTDLVVTNPTAVGADGTSQVCLIVKTFVPANVPLNGIYNYQLNADMTFTNSAITRQLSDIDTVKVSFNGSGELEIEKTVRNITQNDTEGRSNQARPGDTLEYKIYFMNNGSGNIDTIKLFDGVPEFTSLSETVSCNAPATLLPASIASCNIITADGINIVGYEGAIEWQLNGILAPAERGYVIYRVTVK
ncbi:GEVED domain-containing protein [Photobacterium leiognathi]|uniref:GEVED domain-containing protein n=1 Tax=Photobacterium leiognathi TaxID=553611 RepID=UPI0027395DF0|nr:GEVED domain-containing protein [Photobacterium leiognathi]